VKPSTNSPGEAVLVKTAFTVPTGQTGYDPNLVIVIAKMASLITVGNENSTVTGHVSFFKSLDQSAINPENDESHNNGFNSQSQTEKECIIETPDMAPAQPKLVDTIY